MDCLKELVKQIADHAKEHEITIPMKLAGEIAIKLDQLRRILDIASGNYKDY